MVGSCRFSAPEKVKWAVVDGFKGTIVLLCTTIGLSLENTSTETQCHSRLQLTLSSRRGGVALRVMICDACHFPRLASFPFKAPQMQRSLITPLDLHQANWGLRIFERILVSPQKEATVPCGCVQTHMQSILVQNQLKETRKLFVV